MTEQQRPSELFFENEKNFEQEKHNRMFGKAYLKIIDIALGRKEPVPTAEIFSGLPNDLIEIIAPVWQEALNKANAQKTDTKSVLEFLQSRKPVFTNEDLATFEVINNFSGFYTVKIPSETLRKLRPDAKGMAFVPQEGINMLLIPVSQNIVMNRLLEQETVPHEMHHVIWNWSLRTGIVGETTENSDFSKKAFQTYQDELLARISSKGALFGYTQLYSASTEERKEFLQENQEARELNERVWNLNEIWRDVRMLLSSSDTELSDLLLLVWQAKSFADLEQIADSLLEKFTKDNESILIDENT